MFDKDMTRLKGGRYFFIGENGTVYISSLRRHSQNGASEYRMRPSGIYLLGAVWLNG